METIQQLERDYIHRRQLFTVDSLKYSITDVSNKTVEVIGYETKPEGKLEIPATVNIDGTEYKVTGIGKQAFELCSSLKAVTISKNIKNIGIHLLW